MYGKSNQENFNFIGRIYGHVRLNFSISVMVLNICKDIVMHWIFYTLFVKFVVETFFFNKAHFSKVLWLLQWVLFSGKDHYVLLLVFLVLNKFIEINTLIKRNLNFKCEVKSHKVCLQAYCNKLLLKWSYLYLSITWLHGYTSLVPCERWPLDSSSRGVPAANIWSP